MDTLRSIIRDDLSISSKEDHKRAQRGEGGALFSISYLFWVYYIRCSPALYFLLYSEILSPSASFQGIITNTDDEAIILFNLRR